MTSTIAPQRRNTRQRQLVLDAVRAHHDHPTADDIYTDVHARDEHVSRGTVYRNLNLLADAGQIRAVRMPGGDRFDLRVDDHPHVVCRSCGRVIDAPVEAMPRLDDMVASRTGFADVSHATTFTGLCPACRAREEGTEPRFTCVLFDLDGTLIDSLEDLTASGNHVCAQMGWPSFTPEAFRRLIGHGLVRLAADIIPAEAAAAARARGDYDELLARTLELYRTHYEQHKNDHTAPFPGVPATLDRLAASGVRLGVLTNKDDAPAHELVARDFPGRFDAVQGRAEGMAPKPDPTGALRLMAALGADPARTLMVGDSEPDVQVGANAGIASCGVLWGYRSRAELEVAGADHVAATLEDLESVVLG